MSRRSLLTAALVSGLLVAACGGSTSGSSSPAARRATVGDVVPAGTATPAADATATPAADLGFRPEKNGFAFANYGPDYPGLTPADVQAVFGDGVCAGGSTSPCTLNPQAKQWMDEMNKGAQGGHCYGFSMAALQVFKGTLSPSTFGGSDITQLQITNNAALQRYLALDWAAQLFPGVQAGAVTGTPTDILAKLIDNFQNAATTKESYTLLIFKRDGTGGHAITPYAVVDKGNGQFGVLAYDNNYQGVPRELLVDKNANTWSYNAATNPSEPSSNYDGDATTKSMALKPTTPGEGRQPCFFCGGAGSGSGGASGSAGSTGSAAAGAAPYYEITLNTDNPDSHAHLVFSDDAGHQTGIVNGTLKLDVPGITAIRPVADQIYKEAEEPIYDVAVGTKVAITVDGSALSDSDSESIDIIGPDVDATVDNITIDPGQKDTMALSADGSAIAYKSSRSESPTLLLGHSGETVDYAATLQVHGSGNGTTLAAALTGDTLTIGGSGDEAATFDLVLDRDDANGTQTFKHSGLQLSAGDTASLGISSFTKHGDSIPAKVGGSDQTLNDQG